MIRPLRRLGPVALALTTLAAVAACTTTGAAAPPAQPAGGAPPAQLAGGAPPAVGNPTAAAPPVAAVPVAAPRTSRPPARPVCQGAVIHRVDAADTGPPWQPLCLTVGGVVLVANLGPEGFSVAPADKVECHYEAGIRQCRLLHPGTVRFTITDAAQIRTLDVRIIKASSPPKPAPACLPHGATLTINAADDGPSAWAVCMRTSGTVRVENLGPEGFQVRPAGAVTCTYEAAVRICRFHRPQTVTFTTTRGDAEPRSQTVVAIR
ncbi:hypothetical protein [Actinoplanes sp. NPDC049599]|uniref:hypothetical protein n=1 Tax=Actinoplanes sp. NPDC049599 TaxID=3363903 RepID=UPI0037A88F96